MSKLKKIKKIFAVVLVFTMMTGITSYANSSIAKNVDNGVKTDIVFDDNSYRVIRVEKKDSTIEMKLDKQREILAITTYNSMKIKKYLILVK
jgi:hypothetical protein